MAQRLTASQKLSLKKEANEWDQASDAEWLVLFNKGLPVRTHLRRPGSTNMTLRSLIIALDKSTLCRLERAARRRGLEPETLAATWLAERLLKEQSAFRQRG